jgi:hypothetical protein
MLPDYLPTQVYLRHVSLSAYPTPSGYDYMLDYPHRRIWYLYHLSPAVNPAAR